MPLIGGDFTEIFVSHVELGEHRFNPKSNEDFTVDKGGISTADDENQITANGKMIQIMNRRRWSAEGPIAIDMASDYESDILEKLSAHPELGDWTFTHISGAVWRGKGKPVGPQSFATNTGQLTLKIAGEMTLKKVV